MLCLPNETLLKLRQYFSKTKINVQCCFSETTFSDIKNIRIRNDIISPLIKETKCQGIQQHCHLIFTAV